MTVTPAYRSGPVVRFPVVRASAATLRLVQADGTPVPAGATVTTAREHAPVARDGLVYLTSADGEQRATAEWPGHRCEFRFSRPRDATARNRILATSRAPAATDRSAVAAHECGIACTSGSAANGSGESHAECALRRASRDATLLISPDAAAAVDCSVSTTGVAFNIYDPLATVPNDSTGNVSIICNYLSGGASQLAYTAKLSAGSSGTLTYRGSCSANSIGLNYNLFSDAGRSAVWGDGSAGHRHCPDRSRSVPASATGGAQDSRPVYGRIPGAARRAGRRLHRRDHRDAGVLSSPVRAASPPRCTGSSNVPGRLGASSTQWNSSDSSCRNVVPGLRDLDARRRAATTSAPRPRISMRCAMLAARRDLASDSRCGRCGAHRTARRRPCSRVRRPRRSA